MGDGFGTGIDPAAVFSEIDTDDLEWSQHRRAQAVITDTNVRCPGLLRIHGSDGLTRPCNALLAERVSRPWKLTCRKCKTTTEREPE